MGNAIERLGKNVIGVRTAMLSEGITPFVCFGYGIDFADGSSILDRVATIAMFGELNRTSVVDLGEGVTFNRGSFYFREAEWTVEEMTSVLLDISTRSIHYYLAKYGKDELVSAT
jgi:type II restriction enzyme